jgi:hypothetical protein
MTGKQERKLRKRARIAAAIATQNAWIEDAFMMSVENRHVRDSLFAQARAQLGKRHVVA